MCLRSCQTRLPSSTSSSMPWARSHSACDVTRVGAGNWSTATSHVMSWLPEVPQRRAPSLVTAVRPQPFERVA